MVMQFFLFGLGSTLEVKACVLLMCVGVGLATISELSITVVGFIVGMTAVVGAAQQQVRQNSAGGACVSVVSWTGARCTGSGGGTFARACVLSVTLALCFFFTPRQIVIKRFQQNLEASSNQLLLAYTPYCFAVLTVLSPIDGFLPNAKYALTHRGLNVCSVVAFSNNRGHLSRALIHLGLLCLPI